MHVFPYCLHSCTFSTLLCFLSGILFHLIAHLHGAYIITTFLLLLRFLHFTHLHHYLLIILFQFIAHLFRAYNIACFLLYFLQACVFLTYFALFISSLSQSWQYWSFSFSPNVFLYILMPTLLFSIMLFNL